MPHLSLRLIVPFVLLVVAAPAAAKDKEPPPRPAQVQELYNCRDIADSAARLACFDREVGELQAADTKRDITFADRETVKKTRRGLFGFTLPSLGLFGGDGDEDEIKSVETTVASSSQVGVEVLRAYFINKFGQEEAVDRDIFSRLVTERLQSHPLVTIRREECTSIPSGPAIIATGPLTSPSLAEKLAEVAGEGYLSFFDAVAPVVTPAPEPEAKA